MPVAAQDEVGTVSLDDPEVVTWRDMVHNKDITNKEIKDAYKDFATGYDKCFNTIHPNSKRIFRLHFQLAFSVSRFDFPQTAAYFRIHFNTLIIIIIITVISGVTIDNFSSLYVCIL